MWLWSQTRDGVLLPLYFHKQVDGALADEVDLLSLTGAGQETGYYTLYKDAVYVAEYMRHVPLDASKSKFQMALMVWLVQNHINSESAGSVE